MTKKEARAYIRLQDAYHRQELLLTKKKQLIEDIRLLETLSGKIEE